MLLLPAVQLQDQPAAGDEAFVVRPAVVAPAAEQPLIPPAARLDVAHADQGLRTHAISLILRRTRLAEDRIPAVDGHQRSIPGAVAQG